MRKRDELSLPNSCLNKANDDEFIFVILGRDPAAKATIIAWCNERIRLGLNGDYDGTGKVVMDSKLSEAIECANKMEEERAAPVGGTNE